MNKKRAMRLSGGAAAAVVVTALLAASGTAHGLDNPALKTALTLPAPQIGAPVLLAQADALPVQSPVSYSTEQADRGEKDFTKHCVECHGDELRGGLNGGPPLRGLSFESKYFYEGAPASALFEFMSTLMPPDSPGRFSPAIYANLMAYILKRNGFQAGAPLPSDLEALDKLTMEK